MNSRATDYLSAPLLLDFGALPDLAGKEAENYRTAEPYPHIMLEDFVSAGVVDKLVAEFPQPESEVDWRQLSRNCRPSSTKSSMPPDSPKKPAKGNRVPTRPPSVA